MYENEITKLLNEIHSPAFGSEIDKALKSSRLSEMNARAKVRESASRAEAAGLSTDEFVQLAIASLTSNTPVQTPKPTSPAWSPSWDRKQTNDYLRQHGYKWSKEIRDWRDEGEVTDNQIWVLRSPDGRQVSVNQAIKEIG